MTRSATLSTTARALLTAASARDDRLALAPERLPAAARRAVVQSLLKTGLLQYTEEKHPKFGAVVRNICPASPGMKDWQPAAFSPKTGLLYIPHQNLCMDVEETDANYISGTPYVGMNVLLMGVSTKAGAPPGTEGAVRTRVEGFSTDVTLQNVVQHRGLQSQQGLFPVKTAQRSAPHLTAPPADTKVNRHKDEVTALRRLALRPPPASFQPVWRL